MRGRYDEAEVLLPDKSRRRLRNLAYVARKVESSRRRDDSLFVGHHEEVAALPPDHQVRWLKRAADEQMTVRGLRRAIAAERIPGLTDPDTVPDEPADADIDVQPGDLYALGPHRVLCGEAMGSADYLWLLCGGETAYGAARRGGAPWPSASTVRRGSGSGCDRAVREGQLSVGGPSAGLWAQALVAAGPGSARLRSRRQLVDRLRQPPRFLQRQPLLPAIAVGEEQAGWRAHDADALATLADRDLDRAWIPPAAGHRAGYAASSGGCPCGQRPGSLPRPASSAMNACMQEEQK